MKAWASSRRSIARCSSSTSPGTRARRAARGGRLDGGGLEVGHRSEGRREDVGLVLRHPGDRAQEPQDVPASLVLLEVHEPLRDGLLPGPDGGPLLPDPRGPRPGARRPPRGPLVLRGAREPLRDGLLPGLDGGRLLPDDPLPLLAGPLLRLAVLPPRPGPRPAPRPPPP